MPAVNIKQITVSFLLQPMTSLNEHCLFRQSYIDENWLTNYSRATIIGLTEIDERCLGQWTIETIAKNRNANFSGFYQVPTQARGE